MAEWFVRRGIRDGTAGIKTARFWLPEIILGPLGSWAAVHRYGNDDAMSTVVLGVLGGLVPVLGLAALVFGWSLVRAPFRQRDDACSALHDLTHDIDSLIAELSEDTPEGLRPGFCLLKVLVMLEDALIYGSDDGSLQHYAREAFADPSYKSRRPSIFTTPLMRLGAIERRPETGAERYVVRGSETLGGAATYGHVPVTIYKYHLTERGADIIARAKQQKLTPRKRAATP